MIKTIMDIRAKADTTAKADTDMVNNKTSATIYLTNTEMAIMVMVSNVVTVKMIQDLMDHGINSFSVNNSVKTMNHFFQLFRMNRFPKISTRFLNRISRPRVGVTSDNNVIGEFKSYYMLHMVKLGVSSRWSFQSNSAWGSIATMTIGNTHPS